MRHTLFPVVLAVAVAACQPTHSALPVSAPSDSGDPAPVAKLGSFGIELENRKLDVPPGDDFYQHANGTWQSSYELKPDEQRFGSFIALSYQAEERVKGILDELREQELPPGSEGQKLRDYYASFMDEATLRKKGISALKPSLEAIQSIRNHDELVSAFGRAGIDGTSSPFEAEPAFDRKNPDRYQLTMGHSGLTLPARDFYLEKGMEAIRAGLLSDMERMLGFTGLSAEQAKTAATKVLALETSIAKHHWSRTELRDRTKTYNIYTLKKLEQQAPSYPWRRHFGAAKLDPTTFHELNVLTPSALAPLAKLVKDTPLTTWKSYLTYHLISNHAFLLGDEIDNAHFEFAGKVLGGQQEQRARWKRAVQLVGAKSSLGDAISKIYVERYFPPESRERMDELVSNLQSAFADRLAALEWMGPETKKEAQRKLDSFNPKIGFPKKWTDFSSVTIVPGDLMANYQAVREYWYDDTVGRLDKPTDKDEWFMTPHTINAYYNPSFNEIVFPAAILEPPFFDPAADPAVNYGAIGGVIGHEMGHGFDDQGSRSDADGVQRDWWTERDRRAFEQRTERLVAQYNEYEPLPGHKINGQLTLGENIGDLGGLSIAYAAYRKSLGGQEAPVIAGLSGDQRFFLSWAQVWRSKYRDEAQLRRLKADPHSPEQYRVNGIVRNMAAWHEAFGVTPEHDLYLAPDQRVSIW